MKDFHFFASSAFDWGITNDKRDLAELIRIMTGFGHDFNVWLVPCSHEVQYEINWFAPQVEGSVVVGEFTVNKKGAKKHPRQSRWEKELAAE